MLTTLGLKRHPRKLSTVHLPSQPSIPLGSVNPWIMEVETFNSSRLGLRAAAQVKVRECGRGLLWSRLNAGPVFGYGAAEGRCANVALYK